MSAEKIEKLNGETQNTGRLTIINSKIIILLILKKLQKGNYTNSVLFDSYLFIIF